MGRGADSPGRFCVLGLRTAALIRHGFAVPPAPKGEGLGADYIKALVRDEVNAYKESAGIRLYGWKL